MTGKLLATSDNFVSFRAAEQSEETDSKVCGKTRSLNAHADKPAARTAVHSTATVEKRVH
jgi:hypothetical protein